MTTRLTSLMKTAAVLVIEWTIFCLVFNTVVHELLRLTA